MRKAIVTAASKGIGWGAARSLLDSGYAVGITGRDVRDLQDLKSRHSSLEILEADHRVPGATGKAIFSLVERLGGLDIADLGILVFRHRAAGLGMRRVHEGAGNKSEEEK